MAAAPARAEPGRIKALFLGDNGHHTPAPRAAELIPALALAGIDVAYTDDLADLNPANLARYDCLIIYANHDDDRARPGTGAAGVRRGRQGAGRAALRVVLLPQLAEVCRAGRRPVQEPQDGRLSRRPSTSPTIPAMKGVKEFEAWDETYTHTKLSDDRETLMTRAEGGKGEPWTWVRTQGKGRVFYTASGHDERVFTQPRVPRPGRAGGALGGRPAGLHLAHRAVRHAAGRAAELPRGRTGQPRAVQRDAGAAFAVAESMRHISTPGGFRVELFAAEPDIVKPITHELGRPRPRLDRRDGRLPQRAPADGQRATTGSRSARTPTATARPTSSPIFADKLSIPTSMVHAAGGLIVTQAPDMLFLQDTDGDDKADVRKVLFTGWSMQRHARRAEQPAARAGRLDLSDRRLLGLRGRPSAASGSRSSSRSFRFKPDGSEAGGPDLDEQQHLGPRPRRDGRDRLLDGQRRALVVRRRSPTGRSSRSAAGSARGTPGWPTTRTCTRSPRSARSTGSAASPRRRATRSTPHGSFPPQFWNRIAFVDRADGPPGRTWTGSSARGAASSPATASTCSPAPTSGPRRSLAEVGPDGAVWVIDWYNYVVQHNPTPAGFKTGKGAAYETPLRDKTHGRIYRVINETTPLGKSFDLASAGPTYCWRRSRATTCSGGCGRSGRSSRRARRR